MQKSIDLSNLKLTQATMEIRFQNAYILWDRTGLVWSKASSEWPNIKMGKADPMVTTFTLDDRYEIALKLDRAHLVDMQPSSSLKELMENSEIFVNLVADCLDITEFTRLGFRLIFSKKFQDKTEAANALILTKVMSVPIGKHFNIEGQVLMPEYSLKWEGESTGVRVKLSAQDKKIDLNVVPGVEEITPLHIQHSEIVYDIDYYTLKNTKRGQLNVKEWISQAYHLVKRDSKVFTGG
jgi:hypothetical protein